jgi:hypothetical protein
MLDGIGTPVEADAFIKVLAGPSEFIPIPEANHYFSNLVVSGWKYRPGCCTFHMGRNWSVFVYQLF